MTTPAHESVHVLLGRVVADVDAVAKDRVNLDQKFKFRGIEDALNTLHPIFAKHGIVVAPEVLEHDMSITRTTRSGSQMNVALVKMAFTFYGPAGDSFRTVTVGEAQDMADKASNKAMAAAFKYALFFAFTVPTQDSIDDADSTTEAASRAVDNGTRQTNTGTPAAPPPAADGPVKTAAEYAAAATLQAGNRPAVIALMRESATLGNELVEVAGQQVKLSAHMQACMTASAS